MERYQENKRIRKQAKLRLFIILIIIGFFIGGLNIVDENYHRINGASEYKLFHYEYVAQAHRFHLFGNTYNIKQEKIITTINNIGDTVYNIKDKIVDIIITIKDNIIKLKESV